MKITRKIFYFAGIIIFLTGCQTASVKDDIAAREKIAAMPVQIFTILEYARLAPSSHNTQPWEVKIISENEVIIQSDSSRQLSKVDPLARELLQSIGAFWESFRLAALAQGFTCESEILAKNPEDTDIIRIKLVPCEKSNENSLFLMKERATNRKPYSKAELKPVASSLLKEISPGNIFYFTRKSVQGEWLAKCLVSAARKQVYDNEKQEELSRWLRFSRKEAKQKQDGLTPEALGLSGFDSFLWYHFLNQKKAMTISFRNRAVYNAGNQADNCAGFIIITGNDFSTSSLLEAGRQLLRLELKCAELRIAFQPMSQLTEESPWDEELPEYLGIEKPVQFILRLGYSVFSPEPGIRRNIEDFVSISQVKPKSSVVSKGGQSKEEYDGNP